MGIQLRVREQEGELKNKKLNADKKQIREQNGIEYKSGIFSHTNSIIRN